MYYIYMLIDPRKNLPFYIGKGKGRRAQTHLWEIPETRNEYKENIIAAIRSLGLEPEIRYLIENIEDETTAYNIEATLIKAYGRKGYDPGGILANICEDSRPPNHKGKKYEEIYKSKERADAQRALRSKLQKERGGYGPRQHSLETRRKISEKGRGRKLGPCSEERKQKIRENRTPARGESHPESKHWVLTSPTGEKYEQIGDLTGLCNSIGISPATMHAAYSKKRIPNRGPAKGWKIDTISRSIHTNR